jgi:coproporphyrinogen III oxidase
MNKEMTEKQSLASAWFRDLRDQICQEFEQIEAQFDASGCKFERKLWQRPGGGGGEMSLMRGRVFEKVGVNISTVYGEFSEEARQEIPGAKEHPAFFATGISLVAHMQSPLVPAVHMNTRFIETSVSWFGGGADLNPTFPDEEDTKLFHQALKKACDAHNPSYYPKYKEACDKYFYIHHRNRSRGVGGIFCDNLNSGNWENDFAFIKDIGLVFKKIYPQIVRKNMYKPWTEEQREELLYNRGYYSEFNLIWDRGTRFGIITNGNPEAVLMSLPPIAKW